MPRFRKSREFVSDAEAPEGFAPKPLSEIRGPRPTPSTHAEEAMEKPRVKLYKIGDEVPPHLRWTPPPEAPKQNPNSPGIKEQAAAIEALLERRIEQQKQETLKRLKDPRNLSMIHEIAAARNRIKNGPEVQEPVEEKSDDGTEEAS